ncbi:glycosyl hydrolase family 28-related protein [Lentisphaera marina]|uniref:glycosyl hydrolase family 28-related protein n=1 Tax=Lentisphaera marina TaxID=1111041 RepID=UPI0023669F5C|nr:glycosyl hydrolase family 28-related protein [Lentisphaera marina]MDD7985385.1 glycosyl hydrolase family 28-related protein [Lentisphaera marina]
MYIKLISLIFLLSQLALCDNYQYSKLWGKEGELWSAKSQLPDFSFAGYHSGEKIVPHVPISSNVRDFGAIPNSGKDVTEAFRKAIAASTDGAIFIPAGHYILSPESVIRF